MIHGNHPDVQNVYVAYGDSDQQMWLPPAFHCPPPFGSNVGGTSPAFLNAMPTSQFDSWLTVGITEGDAHNDLSNIGISWDQWTATHPLVRCSRLAAARYLWCAATRDLCPMPRRTSRWSTMAPSST